MDSLFKNKKKEVSSGTIKGIQALNGQYKKFDDSIRPESPDPMQVHETDNQNELFTEVNDGQFVTFLVKEESRILPDSNGTKHEMVGPVQTNSTDTFLKRQESVEKTPNSDKTKNVPQNVISTTENRKAEESDSCNETEGEENFCKKCKMKVTIGKDRDLKDISTQYEDNFKDFKRQQPFSNHGEENREIRTEKQMELHEIESLFDTIQTCYKKFTGKNSVLNSNAKFYDNVHVNIRDALLKIYEIMEYAENAKKQYAKDKKKASHIENKGRMDDIQGMSDSTVSDLYTKFEQQKKEITNVTAQNQALMSTLQEHTRLHRELELKVSNLEQEKESLLIRLSTIAGSRLRDGNPSITDLSDDNRPLNVAERFSELYDNEWSDAFEKVAIGRSEEETVKILLELLQNIYTSCEIISEQQRHHLGQFGIYFDEEIDSPHVIAEQGQKSKEIQLMCGTDSVGRVQKKILADKEFQTKYGEYIHSCEIYIKASISICWMMRMQEVPMFLDFTCQREDPLNRDFYKEYTKSGKLCDYLVWPLLLLHIDGPVMQKGIVQPL
ncbi:uncharacterized protein LOC134248026 [Saccostrea cucullata]|uniref:uncharacterized protein LOC134248026 n=1 Tax=Saccostrea cuccullata TaxID=36930 RepID=UPI002ED4EE0F